MAETASELQEEIEKLERKHAENPEGRFFVPLANAYRKLGRLQAAESLLREGLRRHPEYLSAHIVLGRCLAERGATAEASEEFRYVLSLDPQNLVALRSLGELSLSAGRTDEAGRWYQELLTADPMNEEARRALESLQEPEPRDEALAQEAAAEPLAVAPAQSAPEEDLQDGTVPFSPPDDVREEVGLGGEDEDFAFYGGFVELGDESAGEGGELPLLEDEGPDLVTETIAELYARQGLYDRSADVYRELLRRRGPEPGLQRRLEEMERLAGGSPPAQPEPEYLDSQPDSPSTEPPPVFDAAAEEDHFASSFSYGFSDAEAAAAESSGVDLPVDLPADTGPGFDLGGEVEPAREPETQTIREFLAELAGWRPGATPPAPPEGTGTEPRHEDIFFPESAPPAETQAEVQEYVSPTGGTGRADDDLFPWELPESDAIAMESVGDDREGGPESEPDRVPTDEAVSYGGTGEAVLHEGDGFAGADRTAEEEAPSPEPPEPESPAAEPATPAAAEDDDDLESFQAWLRSLKR